MVSRGAVVRKRVYRLEGANSLCDWRLSGEDWVNRDFSDGKELVEHGEVLWRKVRMAKKYFHDSLKERTAAETDQSRQTSSNQGLAILAGCDELMKWIAAAAGRVECWRGAPRLVARQRHRGSSLSIKTGLA